MTTFYSNLKLSVTQLINFYIKSNTIPSGYKNNKLSLILVLLLISVVFFFIRFYFASIIEIIESFFYHSSLISVIFAIAMIFTAVLITTVYISYIILNILLRGYNMLNIKRENLLWSDFKPVAQIYMFKNTALLFFSIFILYKFILLAQTHEFTSNIISLICVSAFNVSLIFFFISNEKLNYNNLNKPVQWGWIEISVASFVGLYLTSVLTLISISTWKEIINQIWTDNIEAVYMADPNADERTLNETIEENTSHGKSTAKTMIKINGPKKTHYHGHDADVDGNAILQSEVNSSQDGKPVVLTTPPQENQIASTQTNPSNQMNCDPSFNKIPSLDLNIKNEVSFDLKGKSKMNYNVDKESLRNSEPSLKESFNLSDSISKESENYGSSENWSYYKANKHNFDARMRFNLWDQVKVHFNMLNINSHDVDHKTRLTVNFGFKNKHNESIDYSKLTNWAFNDPLYPVYSKNSNYSSVFYMMLNKDDWGHFVTTFSPLKNSLNITNPLWVVESLINRHFDIKRIIFLPLYKEHYYMYNNLCEALLRYNIDMVDSKIEYNKFLNSILAGEKSMNSSSMLTINWNGKNSAVPNYYTVWFTGVEWRVMHDIGILKHVQQVLKEELNYNYDKQNSVVNSAVSLPKILDYKPNNIIDTDEFKSLRYNAFLEILTTQDIALIPYYDSLFKTLDLDYEILRGFIKHFSKTWIFNEKNKFIDHDTFKDWLFSTGFPSEESLVSENKTDSFETPTSSILELLREHSVKTMASDPDWTEEKLYEFYDIPKWLIKANTDINININIPNAATNTNDNTSIINIVNTVNTVNTINTVNTEENGIQSSPKKPNIIKKFGTLFKNAFKNTKK